MWWCLDAPQVRRAPTTATLSPEPTAGGQSEAQPKEVSVLSPECLLPRSRIISSDGVSTDPAKVQSVATWPVPVSVAELRSFLGLAAYYRRFVRAFSDIAAPLYRLLEKDSDFRWTEQCDAAFTALKQKLVTAPVLAYPRVEDTFLLDTDASDRGIGAVLSQCQNGVERVIAYGSRTLTKT